MQEPVFSKNLAAIVKGDRKISLENHHIEGIGSNDVLLAISSVGICGSDLKYWAYGKCGRFSLNGNPMVIGHEAAGTVVSVGRKINHLKPGDRVAIEPGVPCKKCEICLEGRYNLCKDVKFCATPPINGNLCQYYVHDGDFCFKIPDSMTMEQAAMLEPLSVAVYTCQRGNIGFGHTVVIFGAGPIGILCGLVAKSMGAAKVCTVDIDEHRLAIAMKQKAADVTYLITSATPEDPVEYAEELVKTIGSSPRCSLECSGVDKSLAAAIHVTRPGGAVVLVGRGSMNPNVPIVVAATKEVDIKGVFRYANNYQQAMDLVSSGAIDVLPLITHRFALENAGKAFETACDGNQKAIKVMINCGNTK